MRWDWQQRALRVSVGELARFSLVAAGDEGAGRWRMELGTHWHTVLRERTAAGGDGWQFEHAVEGTLTQEGWQFILQGRIDQYHAAASPPLVREVKTVNCPLPASEDELRERYPHYFHQAMLYAFLLGRRGAFPAGEVLFLEIQTGLTQTVTLGERDLEALHAHLCAVVAILEERRAHFLQLRNFVVPQPFAEWRPGQQEAREALDAAMERSHTLLFEAPTGFGKTGLALEQGLLRLAAGEVERILLLTSKNTGHTPLLNQVEAFREAGPGLTVHALRSRRDLTVDHEQERLLSPADIAERWRQSGLSAPKLLADGILDLESLRELGRRHGIPPWAISRLLLPYADIWIADYNYLFDPGVARVLEAVPTWDPARTLLIVDEAHNLPERAAASRSHTLDAQEVGALLSEVQFARFPGQLGRLLDLLLSMLKRQAPVDELDPPFEADLVGLLREMDNAFKESSFGDDELSLDSLEWLWNLSFLLADWDHPQLPFHCHCPVRGRVVLSCLDAAAATGPLLKQFAKVMLMSATLQPWDNFRTACGIGAAAQVTGRAPWLEGCFEVLVDARVDTRFRQRDQYLDTTAAAIGESALARKGCCVAFFPSYLYAEKVLERLAFHYPALRCELQPRNLPLEEQTAFLEHALILDDVLLLVLGSRFSEGIDALGGRVGQAIVVGPALPEVNGLQKAREALVAGGKAAAFRSVYLIPGLRKISQALGRLVRTPDQHARVLLHGKRFLEPEYQDLLPPYLCPDGYIVTDQDFAEKWLHG